MTKSHFTEEAWQPMAAAWEAYLDGDESATLLIHADDGDRETMSVSLFFRGWGDLRAVDGEALSRATGKVLDVGAGVGSLALLLQERGVDVTGLEVIPQGVKIMQARGVKKVLAGRLEDIPKNRRFDTVLLLMNGTALAGTLNGLPGLLGELEGLLAPGGQVLMDSTDVTAEDGWEGEEYPGELVYQMEFRGERGAPFPQLFVDPKTLATFGSAGGWTVTTVWEGDDGEYLAKLTR